MLPETKPFHRYWLVFAILSSGFLIRLCGIWYGFPYVYSPDINSPDEHLIMGPIIHTLVSGDINPHWAGFPAGVIIHFLTIIFTALNAIAYLLLYITGHVHVLADFWLLIQPHIAIYTSTLYGIARFVMVLCATVTIYLTYLLGEKLFSRPAGVLAALCLALAPLHVMHSRIIRPDIVTTLCIIAALYLLYRFDQERERQSLLIAASLAAGCAVAAKYTSLVIILPLVAYGILLDYHENRLSVCGYLVGFCTLCTYTSRIAFYSFLGFFATAPFTILDITQTLTNLAVETRTEHIGHERLAGIHNYAWYLKTVMVEGAGSWLITLSAGIGLMLAVAKRSYRFYIFLLFPVAYFLLIAGLGTLRWERWLIPLLPFEAILCGAGAWYLYQRGKTMLLAQRHMLAYRIAWGAIALVALLPPLMHDIHEAALLTKTDTRTWAKEWIEENLAAGSRIAIESDAPQFFILPKKNFFVLDCGAAIVNKPLSYYRENRIDYIIVSEDLKDLVCREPVRYRVPIDRYKELKHDTILVKVFGNADRPGPTLELYRLSSR